MNEDIRPTLSKPVSDQSKKFEKNFSSVMKQNKIDLNETDELLTEKEQSLKKKIFSLAKMEALVFSDPKLSAVYEEMAENGSEKFGYHYNETIHNIIFNDYVLNSPKYLQKYKMAIPKKSKRRDKSGINQLKKAGEIAMTKTNYRNKPTLGEEEEDLTKVLFLVNDTDQDYGADVFAYFPEENYDNGGYLKTGYAHVGQHTAVSPEYAKESREATPEEYSDLKRELEGQGYNLEVLNSANETTGAGGGGAGAFAPALGYEKQVDETTTAASSGAYSGPAAWGGGDLMRGGKSKAMRKPIWQGGTIIQESNYLTDSQGFEKYIKALNEDDSYDTIQNQYEKTHSGSNKGLGVSVVPQDNDRKKKEKEIGDNMMLFTDQDVALMRDKDVDILHNDVTKTNSYFPHPNNPNLPDDGISGNKNEGFTINNPKNAQKPNVPADTNKEINNRIINKSNAFTSNGVKKWDKSDTDLELNTINTGTMDTPNLKTENMENIDNVSEGISPKYTTNEELKELIRSLKEKTGKGLQKEHIPMLAGEALYTIAMKMANAIIPMGWDGLSDVNSMWDYIRRNGGMSLEQLRSAVKRGINVRLKEDGYTLKDIGLDEDSQSMIGDHQDSMSNKMQATGTQGSGVQMGFTQSSGLQESLNLFEELNNELDAYSIHHNKLKKMAEDRKPSALVLRDRVGSENEKNFKKDLQHSGTKEIIDIEKELEYKDQQTEVGDNPQKLGQDIEKKALSVNKGNALKNVGNSDNNDGDEISKRNLSTEEQEEVNMYRLGQQDLVYDNKPSQRFEDRQKADMGETLYKQRQDKMEFRAKAPMYNKDPQPIENTTAKKVQFDKEQTGWNERVGLKEHMISGRYRDLLNKSRIIDFTLNEVASTTSTDDLFKLDFTGLGNAYISRTIDNKVSVNESVSDALTSHSYYTDGKKVFAVKNPKVNLNENTNIKPVVNEQVNKMKHLLGYKPDSFVNTNKTKINRGF